MDRLKYIKLENEDGSYSSSIPLAVDSNHVDVNGNTLTNELNNKANNSSINNLQNQINGLASGSPLVASSTSEMTDTTRIYVNTTNGDWYYYDGSSWVDGGRYQSAEDSTTVDDLSESVRYLEDGTIEFVEAPEYYNESNYWYRKFENDIQPGKLYLFRIKVATSGTYTFQSGTESNAGAMVDTIGQKTLTANVETNFYYEPTGNYQFIRISSNVQWELKAYLVKSVNELSDYIREDKYRFINIDELLSNQSTGLNATGATFSSSNHHTSDFIKVNQGEVFKYALRTTQPSVACFNLYSKPIDTEVVASVVGVNANTTVSGTYTVPQDGYIKVCNRYDFVDGYFYLNKKCPSVVITEINNRTAQMQLDINNLKEDNILTRNKEQINNIFACSDWYRTTALGKRNFALMMFSDLHGDSVRLQNAVDLLNNLECLDAGMFLGDMENSNQSSSMPNTYIPIINQSTKPLLVTMGNHDFRHSKVMTDNPNTLSNSVSRFMGATNDASIYSTNGYGYKDFATYKIRLIVLNQYEYPYDNDGTNYVYYGSGQFYRAGQINWLITTLNSVPEDYTVIIAKHSSEIASKNNIIDSHYGAAHVDIIEETRSTYGNNGYMGDTIIGDIVEAYINKSTLTKNYPYTTTHGDYQSVSVDADFSDAKGVFATYIVGHKHAQAIGKVKGTQNVYINDTSSSSTGWANGYSLIPRKTDNKLQDLITIMCIDTDNKIINFVRVGANRTIFGEIYDVVTINY